jgi:hypothetical protein
VIIGDLLLKSSFSPSKGLCLQQASALLCLVLDSSVSDYAILDIGELSPDDENGEGKQDSIDVAEDLSQGRQTLGVPVR